MNIIQTINTVNGYVIECCNIFVNYASIEDVSRCHKRDAEVAIILFLFFLRLIIHFLFFLEKYIVKLQAISNISDNEPKYLPPPHLH